MRIVAEPSGLDCVAQSAGQGVDDAAFEAGFGDDRLAADHVSAPKPDRQALQRPAGEARRGNARDQSTRKPQLAGRNGVSSAGR